MVTNLGRNIDLLIILMKNRLKETLEVIKKGSKEVSNVRLDVEKDIGDIKMIKQ